MRSRGIHYGIKVDAFLVVIGGTKDEIANTRLNGLGKDALNITKKDGDTKNWIKQNQNSVFKKTR